jgi:hypothetical protein
MFIGSKVWLTTFPLFVNRLSSQCGILNISQPYRPPRPVTGIALLHFNNNNNVGTDWGQCFPVYLSSSCSRLVSHHITTYANDIIHEPCTCNDVALCLICDFCCITVASSEESPVAMKLKKMWLKAPVSEDGDTNLGKCRDGSSCQSRSRWRAPGRRFSIIESRRLCGLVVRVPGYWTEMYCASCEVRTEFIYSDVM